MLNGIAVAQFTSKSSSAGIVDVMLGFEPDFAILIADHGGTNPNIYLWANNALVADWAAALSLLITGSTGVVTRDTSGIAVYAGGDSITTAESTNDAEKHVDQSGYEVGNASGENADLPFVTQAGLAIPADHQVASGKNLLIAFRANR